MADCPGKQRWDAENVRIYTFKLFRKTDEELIEYMENKPKGELIRNALREYMKFHPDVEEETDE